MTIKYECVEIYAGGF